MANYSVYKHGLVWAAKRDDSTQVSSFHRTQAEAYAAARTYC